MNETMSIIEAPPPRRRRGRAKDPLTLKLEAMQPGQCLQYRGSKLLSTCRGLIHYAAQRANLHFTARKTDGGLDIYCIEKPTN